MRLIWTTDDIEKGHTLANYLKEEGIDNELEITTNTDWGSSDYGLSNVRIWIVDEDLLDTSLKITEEFLTNPQDSRFTAVHPHKTPIRLSPDLKDAHIVITPLQPPIEKKPMGLLTLYLIIICTLLYLFSSFTEPSLNLIPSRLQDAIARTFPLQKTLMYDFPKAFSYLDKLIHIYGVESLQKPDDLRPEGKYFLQQFYQTPYWQGFYSAFRNYFLNQDNSWESKASLFEKIREGEVWRLFTPALLHANFLHLFFNMTWIAVLGRQIEEKIGIWRYLFFIILAGIITNTLQYFVGGANFIGFSGVICAMFGFIWVRLKTAAWEGYELEDTVMGFIMLFLIAMFALQAFSFFYEIYTKQSFSPGIGNTAHLSGIALGLILGRLSFFSWKTK